MGLVAVPVNCMEPVAAAREDRQDCGAASDNIGAAGVAGCSDVQVKGRERGVGRRDPKLQERVARVCSCSAAQVCTRPKAV